MFELADEFLVDDTVEDIAMNFTSYTYPDGLHVQVSFNLSVFVMQKMPEVVWC